MHGELIIGHDDSGTCRNRTIKPNQAAIEMQILLLLRHQAAVMDLQGRRAWASKASIVIMPVTWLCTILQPALKEYATFGQLQGQVSVCL